MKRAIAAALMISALAASLACGEDEVGTGAGQVSFDVYVSRAVVDDIGAFQLALVRSEAGITCGELQRTCLNGQLSESDLVRFEDAAGRNVVALNVPVDLRSEGAARVQDTTMRKVPIGKNYLLVVEALSRHEPPRFLGSSCTSRVEVSAGENRVSAQPIQFVADQASDGGTPGDGGSAPGLPCDPRFAN